MITQPDIRWGRCDIKTVGLLPNALAKQAARGSAGAFEAWLVDKDGLVTEGASTNAWIVDADAAANPRPRRKHPARRHPRMLIELAHECQIEVVEKPFSVAEAKIAKEAFRPPPRAFLTPIVSIDGEPVADGRPGPPTRRLRDLYIRRAREEAI